MADGVAGKKVKGGIIAYWDVAVTDFFCKICVQEIEAGNRPHGSLSAKGYANLVEKFADQTGRPYTQKQHKNRWDALKGLYDFWLSLEHTTGIGWDSKLYTYAASDEFWDNNTKERRAIRFGPPANLKELEIMFEKSNVSGLSACIPGQGEQSSPKNLEDINTTETQEVEELSHMRENSRRGAKRKGVKSLNKKAKNPMVRVLSKMVDDVISTNSVTSKAVQGDFMKDEISEAMELAKESGATEASDEHYIATRLFVKSENHVVFMTFETNEGHLNWLKRYYKDRKK